MAAAPATIGADQEVPTPNSPQVWVPPGIAEVQVTFAPWSPAGATIQFAEPKQNRLDPEDKIFFGT
jgi:hypothetical protein